MIRKVKGSITVFGVLSLVLVAGCLLVLLEGARIHQIKQSAALQYESALESVFAAYCSPLWEEYCLLGNDQSEMESRLITYANGRSSEFEWRKNLLKFELGNLKVESYTRITDGQGRVFRNVVSDYMKDNLLYETAKFIYGQYEAISNIADTSDSDLGVIDEALESLKKMQQEDYVNSSHETSKSLAEETSDEVETNPLEEVKKLQSVGILELLVENPEELSQKSFDKSQAVSNRTLHTGKNSRIEEDTWIDRILFQQYVISYLSAFTNEKADRALSYELEYLIGGAESDIENLKSVATGLISIRMVANSLYVFNDSTKVAEADALALAIAGITVSPELYEPVKVALLTAWAFGESVLDVRGLLQGKRIPLLKSNESWTLQLSGIGELTSGFMTAKESDVGLSYMDYLGMMLLFLNDETTAMRTMDMQEATIRKVDGYDSFYMDNLIIQAEVAMTYEYKPVFQVLSNISEGLEWNHEIVERINYQYGD